MILIREFEAAVAGSVATTGRVVVADESPLTDGTRVEITARGMETSFFDLDAPTQRVGVPDVYAPFNPALEEEVPPTKSTVRKAVERTV